MDEQEIGETGPGADHGAETAGRAHRADRADLVVRAASPSDEDALVENTLAMAQEAEGVTLDGSTTRPAIREALLDPEIGHYWVAEREGIVVGSLMVSREWSDWRGGWYWWIQTVYVAPAQRGTGVFEALLEGVIERARQERVHAVRLYVHRDNARARRVYDRTGFADTDYLVKERVL